MKKIVTIGLTGGVGTGKSTVAAILKNFGAVTIDTDRVAQADADDIRAVRRLAARCNGNR